MRKRVGQILKQYGLNNRFTIRKVDFSDLARVVVHNVTIKDWKPNARLAKLIEQEMEYEGSVTGNRMIVDFEGVVQ